MNFGYSLFGVEAYYILYPTWGKEPVAEPKILAVWYEKSIGYARKIRKNAEALEGIFPKIRPQNDPDLLHKMASQRCTLYQYDIVLQKT